MTRLLPIALLSLLPMVEVADAQSRRRSPPRPLATHVQPTAPGIAWFGTWKEAQAEAKRTNRPILLMAAAPVCQGVPGVW